MKHKLNKKGGKQIDLERFQLSHGRSQMADSCMIFHFLGLEVLASFRELICVWDECFKDLIMALCKSFTLKMP